MPHQVHQRKFSRMSAARKGMLRNLTLSVLRYEKVRTTTAKAKVIRGFVDEMINLGKDGSLAARRKAIAWLPEMAIVEKVFSDLPARFSNRTSGYTRLTPMPNRVGDNAPTTLIELMPGVEETLPAEEEAKPRRRLGLPGRSAPKKTEAAVAKKAVSGSSQAKPKAATPQKKTAKKAAAKA